MKKTFCYGKNDICEDITECFRCDFFNGKGYEERETKETIFEKLKAMSIEEMAEWLFSNCEYLSAEYGDCSGAEDSHRMLEFLKSAED